MGQGEGSGAWLSVGQAKNVCRWKGSCWVTRQTADIVKVVANWKRETKTLSPGRGHRQTTWDWEQREAPWKGFHGLMNAFTLTGKDVWRVKLEGSKLVPAQTNQAAAERLRGRQMRTP